MARFLGLDSFPNIFPGIYANEQTPTNDDDYLWESAHHSEREVYEWYLKKYTSLPIEYLDIIDPEKVYDMMVKDGFYISKVRYMVCSPNIKDQRLANLFLVFSKVH